MNWSHLNRHHFLKMRLRHKALWVWVEEFIKSHEIQSIFEVGPGMEPVTPSLVKDYYAIDLHPRAQAIHGDFLEANVRELPRAELLLACNVIEHCCGYEPFFQQVGLYAAPFAIISFFNRIHRHKDVIHTQSTGIYKNRYSRAKMTEWLEERQVNHSWHVLKRNTAILLLEGENGS